MPSSYSLSQIEKYEIEALVKAGYYASKSDVVRDAIRKLLETDKGKRIAAAIQMYEDGVVSLSKAAEIAGMTTPEFKEELKERGIKRVLKANSTKKMDKRLKKVFK